VCLPFLAPVAPPTVGREPSEGNRTGLGPVTEANVIIGAGQAGGWAAIAMRQAGFTGRVLLIGDEPFLPYERPPLSKALLIAAEEPPVPYFREAARYAEHAIEVETGAEAASIDTAARLVRLRDGRTVAYDRLLIATGGAARRLTCPGAEHALVLRTLEDARVARARLRAARRVVCVGGGVIGLEIASAAVALGAAVTVLEAGPRLLGRAVTAEVAEAVADLHRAAGVALRLGAAVERIEGPAGGPFRLLCGDGAVLEADLVLAGIGMSRNDALAADAGIDTDVGVLVDECGRTSVPGVFAAGDVAAFWHPTFGRRLRVESWRHAQNHGIAVGRAMAGDAQPYLDIPWFWTDQHGVNLQVAGLPELARRTIMRPALAPPGFTAVHLDDEDRVVAVSAADAPRDIRAGTALIRGRLPVDAAALADPSRPLAGFAR
jgi:3-phenylpropionate/trans-cinnamate dioxygenase ferredoxin reductase subunit